MNYVFFILPFFLYAGIALQSAGFIICCCLSPLVLIYKGYLKFKTDNFFVLSILLFFLWAIFPAFNFLHFFLNKSELITIKKLLSSHMSSSILFFSISILLILFFQNVFTKKKIKNKNENNLDLLEQLVFGFFYASLIIFIYCTFQHFTGFHFLISNYYLSDEHLMSSGTYRIFGFFGHPLSMASVSLAIFIFFANIFMYLITIKTTSKILKIKYLSFSIATLNFLLVMMSGSRFAAMISIGSLLFLYLKNILFTKNKIPFISFLLFILFTLIFLYNFGIYSRISQLFSFIQIKTLDNFFHKAVSIPNLHRFIFWKIHWTMFTDSPWIGHGYAQLYTYIREAYYIKLGYQNFPFYFNAHNFFLQLLAEIGFVGFSIFFCSLYKFFDLLKKITHKSTQLNLSSVILSSFALSIIANLVHGLIQNTFFDSSLIIIYSSLAFFALSFPTLVRNKF